MQHSNRARLLVVGDDDWPLLGTVTEGVLAWWIGAERPDLTVVVERGTRIGEHVASQVDTDSTGVEFLPPPPAADSRAYRKRQLAAIAGADHVLLFTTGFPFWEYAAQQHTPITTTRVTTS